MGAALEQERLMYQDRAIGVQRVTGTQLHVNSPGQMLPFRSAWRFWRRRKYCLYRYDGSNSCV